MTNEIKISLKEIKRLITKEGYFRFNREAKEDGEKSIEDYYNLSPGEVQRLFEENEELLKGLKRNKLRNLVLINDLEKDSEEVEIKEIKEPIKNVKIILQEDEEEKEEEDETKAEEENEEEIVVPTSDALSFEDIKASDKEEEFKESHGIAF